MTLRFFPILLMASALAQESQPILNPLEKEFERAMSVVTMAGHFTKEGGDGLSSDKYNIDKVTKLKDDLWRFDARIQYGGTNGKAPLPVHVKWAGDTPALLPTDQSLARPGQLTGSIVVS